MHTNYGGLLQAYALQQILKGMGHDVVTDRLGVVRKLPLWNRALRFLYHAVQFCILKNYRYYPYRYLFVSFDKESKAKRSISINTERFVNTHIDTIDLLTRSNESVIDAVRQFDAIVVGSDQVWRATMSDIPTYFLSFTKAINVKRIAYAASFGTDDLNEYSKMDMKIASESIIENNVPECVFPSVSRWLAGFRDAQFVVTDSFHGTVFSIIFNKPFVAILNSERGASRFISLLSILGLENRLISTGDEVSEEHLRPIDYTEVNKILNEWKLKSINYIRKWT